MNRSATQWTRLSVIVAIIAGSWLSTGSGVAATWRVKNSGETKFTIYAWPVSESRGSGFAVEVALPANDARDVTLQDKDPYHLQVKAEINDGNGGTRNLFVPSLKPVNLHAIAASGAVFDVNLVLAAIQLSPDKLGAEGRVFFNAADTRFDIGDHTGFRAKLENSEWDTTFSTAGGQRVNARLNFDGDHGSFVTSSFTGKLTDIFYIFNGDAITIEGTWSGAGSAGPFRFTTSRNNAMKFDGEWAFQGKDAWHSWTGSRR